jgi:hypothetical protein
MELSPLPVATFGLSVVIFSRTKVKLWLIFVITVAFNVFLTIMTGLAIALTYDHGLWAESGSFILFASIPLWMIHPKMILYTGGLSTVTRFAGLVIGVVTPRAYFPFCQLRGWSFAGPLLVLMAVNMILAVYTNSLAPR